MATAMAHGPVSASCSSADSSAASAAASAAAAPAGSEVEREVLELFAKGSLTAATELLLDATSAPPGQTARHYVLLGEAHRMAGEPDTALEDFRVALTAHGSAAVGGPAQYSRGLCFMSLGEWYAAAESFMQSAPGAELSPDALVSIGTCSRRLGDTERALQFFTRALDLDPDHTHGRMCRAELQEALGENAGAAEDYRQLLAYDPNFSASYLREAYIAAASGEYGACGALCDGMLKALAHADETAPDALYIEAQRQQFLALELQCNQNQNAPLSAGQSAGAAR